MNYQQLVESISPDIYEKLKQAVELGKWPDGKKLTAEQKQHCLEAVITYDLKFKDQQQRVGYIYTPKHDHCGSDGISSGESKNNPDGTEILAWKN